MSDLGFIQQRSPVTVIDKRESHRTPSGWDYAAEAYRQAQADWTELAAGSMWWDAQRHAQNGRVELADRIMDQRTQLLEAARSKGITSL